MAHPEMEAFLRASRSCALAMLENASYVATELPALGLSEPLHRQVSKVCSRLIGTKHDVFTEVDEVSELGEAFTSPNVQRRIERIVAWLADELPSLHGLVEALEAASSADDRAALGYLLVAESATNVYRAFEDVSLAAKGTARRCQELRAASGRHCL
jgi:hypothetical protein